MLNSISRLKVFVMDNVIIINRDQMGHGDSELGQKMLNSFIGEMSRRDGLTAIVLYNSGVKLIAKDSPFVPLFAQLIENGVDVLPCGTCISYYELELGTGQVSDMPTIARTLDQAAKTITI